jgi:hypothetical protein
VFITDEYGYLSELDVEMDGKDVTKVYVYVKQKVHCHDALIRGMVYDERLSVVVTFDINGVVCINNAHSLSLICVIEPDVKMIQCYNGKVVDVKINKRDFIYVVYTNGIIAYTLGGMKISEYINEHHIIKGIEIDYDENIIINEGNTIKSVCMCNLQSTLHEESFHETEIKNVYVLRNIKSKWYVCSNGKVLKRKYD